MRLTLQQKLAKQLIDSNSCVNAYGQRIATGPEGSNTKLTLNGIKTTVKRWAWFAAYGEWPKARINVLSKVPNIIDVDQFYTMEDFE